MEEFASLLGDSPAINAVRQSLRHMLARTKSGRRLPAVLIGGETGTGKGLVARLIHREGPRAHGPFVDINCAAIPDNLLEAELFGFERGAFTDARRAKPGLFQTAHRGTIFLDEVGLLPETMQAKLLKVIEDQAVRRLGGTTSEPVDIAIISASNVDLALAATGRRFRQDLFHRLAVLTIELPPLRERGRDVVLLANHFLRRACTEYGLSPKRLTAPAEERLLLYPWPGNIRELGNVIERVALLIEDDEVGAEHLELPDARDQAPAERVTTAAPTLADAMRDHLLSALEHSRWNISKTAASLGISRNTVRARIERFGLNPDLLGPRAMRAPVSTPRSPRREHAEPAPAAAAHLSVRWEQRRITFLRAMVIKVADDVELLKSTRALDTLMEKARSFGGQIEELGPRGIGAVFGLEPVEDAPRRAAHAAMAIQKAAERAGEEQGEGFAVKIGVHVGEVLVGHASIGPQIDSEARREHWRTLDALLEPLDAGKTLVTHAAMPFLERRFELVLEGVGPNPVYRLGGRERKGLAPEGHMTSFVGRSIELDLLRGLLTTAKSGTTQVIVVAGEAGIGKSRLLHEFRQTLRGEKVTYLEGQCVSYGTNIPYLPIITALRRGCRVADDDSPTQVAGKIRKTLEHLGLAVEQTMPYVMRFMGFKEGTEHLDGHPPETIRARAAQTLRQMCLNSSRLRPLVLVFEDLHWIDPASEALGAMGEWPAGARLLIILTYRTEYRPSWSALSHATQISLPPLTPNESMSVLQGILPPERLPGLVAQEIVERADGNPFFLEELGRSMREHSGFTTDKETPQTVHEVLLARMNRLPEQERRVLQSAAAIGREVAVKLLGAATGLPGPELTLSLRHLHGGGFLNETGLFPEEQYTFRHALTHEVAYRNLLQEERRALHARIVDSIEQLYPDRLIDFTERLADHALLGEVWDKAVDFLREAGSRAFARGALEEALARYDQALAASDRLPRSEANMRRAIDVRVDLHTPLLVLGQIPRLVELHRQAEAIGRELGDLQRLGRLFQRMSQYSWMEAKYDAGIDYAKRSLELATRMDDPDGVVLATYSLAQSQYSMGQYQTAVELFVRVVEGPNAERAKRLLAATITTYIAVCGWLGQALSNLGELDRAIAYTDLGVQAADDSEHPQAQAIAYTLAAIPRVYRGDVEEAVSLTRRALDLCETKGLLTWLPGASSTLGWALAAAGRLEEGLPYLERGPSILATVGVRTHLALMYVRWAEGLLRAGRSGESCEIARRAIDTARACGERGHEGEGYYALACALASADSPNRESARASFEQARLRAQELGMRPLLARCYQGLGELDRRGGDEIRAREQLAVAADLFRDIGVRRLLKRTPVEQEEVD
jgi:transcriptional regulator with AAA-type ATPase domain/tetratricopeptide (TPR) repeat protein